MPKKNAPWFAIDKNGLAQILERRGKAFLIEELVQNAWDTGATRVDVRIGRSPIGGGSVFEVEDDDPDGFEDLSHAYTLFAPSEKKGNPEKRGRFNLGEKLALALCSSASIASTKGTVSFDHRGRRTSKTKRQAGTLFLGTLTGVTAKDREEIAAAFNRLIPPPGVRTTLNGESPPDRQIVREFEAALQTEIAGPDGNLRSTQRKTKIQLFATLPGETTAIYEMGIPVVATGDRWHVNVLQKVPLNIDRTNVRPSYLRHIRTLVANETCDLLRTEDANTTWVREATSHPDCKPETISKAVDLRFGEKRVIYDPSDPEANKIAVSKGYTVIHGGMLNAGEWEHVRTAGVALPAGQVTPSPKPFSQDGTPLKTIPASEWSQEIRNTVEYFGRVASALIGEHVHVDVVNESAWPFRAVYSRPPLRVILNLGCLGKKWFANPGSEAMLRLLIHELGHHYASDHLSSEYHDALAMIGARLAQLALEQPDLVGTGNRAYAGAAA